MSTDWVEVIAEKMHEVWMDLCIEREGEQKAQEHRHFKPWSELNVDAMNQDRFVASLMLRSLVR